MLCNTLLGDFCPVHTWSWMMLLHLESSNLHLTLESITTCVSSDNLWASLTFLLHLQKKEKCVPLLSAETKVMQFSILVCQKLMLEEEITTILDSVYSLIHSWQTRSPKVFNTLKLSLSFTNIKRHCVSHLRANERTIMLAQRSSMSRAVFHNEASGTISCSLEKQSDLMWLRPAQNLV